MNAKNITLLVVVLFALGAFLFEFSISQPNPNDPVLKQLFDQLEQEGYQVISVESTVLGRYKIEAHSERFEREIVVAPGAGTVLRDDISPSTENDYDGD